MLHFLHAAHHSWLVESPWEERGGVLLIAPPGNLKTTMVFSLEMYAEARCLTDINIRTMKPIRDQIIGGRYRSLAFAEMEKLYARNPATAANVEAHIKLFVEDGLRHFSHEDPTAEIMPARCLVIAGITPSTFGAQITAWRESGFLRRFLRIQYVLEDEMALIDAIHKWKKIGFELPTEWNGRISIPYNLTDADSKFVLGMMRAQPDTTPNVLIKKIACVLKRRTPKSWKKIMIDVAPSLGSNGAMLEL